MAARIRSVFPSQWTDEDFVSCSFAARLLSIALRNEADDNGIFEWKPLALKMRLFPADNVDMPGLLAELIANNQVVSYEIDGRKYGAIRNFRKWQRPKSPNSIHPIPDHFRNYVGLSDPISEMPLDEADAFPGNEEMSPQREEGGGRRENINTSPPSLRSGSPLQAEGDELRLNGGQAKTKPTPAEPQGSRLPADWRCPPEWLAWARGQGHPQPEAEADKFRDYWHAQAAAKGRKADWLATWRNWIRRSLEDLTRRGPHHARSTRPDLGTTSPDQQRARDRAEIAATLGLRTMGADRAGPGGDDTGPVVEAEFVSRGKPSPGD